MADRLFQITGLLLLLTVVECKFIELEISKKIKQKFQKKEFQKKKIEKNWKKNKKML